MSKKTGGIDWKALEKKQGEIVTTGGADVISLDKDGSFIGKYISNEEIQIGDKDPFLSFIFETEKGQQAYSGGMNFAQQMRMINKGSIVRVTYKGKKKTNSGYKVNQFTVEMLDGSINEKERDAIKKEIQEAMKNKKKNTTKKGKK